MKSPRFVFCVCFVATVSFILTMIIFRVASNEETSAGNSLSDYQVVFQGKTNTLGRASFAGILFRKHPMSEYIDMAAPHILSVGWPKDLPIRIEEDDLHVTIILPGSCEINGINEPGVFSSGYSLKVVIDKKTRKIIEAVSG